MTVKKVPAIENKWLKKFLNTVKEEALDKICRFQK
jgi:hypothetical protein